MSKADIEKLNRAKEDAKNTALDFIYYRTYPTTILDDIESCETVTAVDRVMHSAAMKYL